MDERIEQAILAAVREEELVATACELVNIPSPTGEEAEMARCVHALFEATALDVARQEVEPGRANVVGRRKGTGGGKSLMFNAHMDTSNTGREPHLTAPGYKPKAIVQNRMIYGLGIYNMKGALACYVEAARALARAGVRLAGDLILAAVVGEIEKAQWGEEFVGREYRGYGAGTQHLVTHGVLPDACILGEPTDLQLVLGHYGSLWARIATHGPYAHTAFSRGRAKENSIRRMRDVLDAIDAWIPAWEKKAAYGGEKGIVNLGAIRGGDPWRASRTPERTDLFLDVRVPPTIPLGEARRELETLVGELRRRHPDFGIEFETYVSVPGAEIAPEHELVRAIEAQHRRVLGAPPKRATVLWSSDASVLTRYGVPTVNYGPSSGPRDAEGEKVAVETLVHVAKIYALVAAELCGARL
jgi:acetylornithine deacetylase